MGNHIPAPILNLCASACAYIIKLKYKVEVRFIPG